MRERNILVACSGSVATVKLSKLIALLLEIPQVHVKVVVTERAKHFLKEQALPSGITILSDDDEWKEWQTIGDPVLHIELSNWADLLLLAPLGANSLAKIANGLCDNLLTCVARAWGRDKPLLYAPAMNTRMWTHPVTKEHTDKLAAWGYQVIPPVEKKLACGDIGLGAMAECETIVDCVRMQLSR